MINFGQKNILSYWRHVTFEKKYARFTEGQNYVLFICLSDLYHVPVPFLKSYKKAFITLKTATYKKLKFDKKQ